MRRTLRQLINAGVPAEMSPERAKYVRTANLIALSMIPINIPFLVLCLLNNWIGLFLEFVVATVLMLGTMAINRRGRHELASAYFGMLINLHFIVLTVALGRETSLPLLILCGAGGAITLGPRGNPMALVMAVVVVFVSYQAAKFLSGALGPFYELTPRQIALVRTYFVEWGVFIAIVVNAWIGRIGSNAAEDRVRAEQQRAAGLLLRLQEEDRRKTQFFQNISHELRTPLTLVIGPLEGLLTGAADRAPAALRRQLEMMMRNARRLLRLINQLLDLSKLDAGKVGFAPRRGDLRAFVADLAQSFAAHAERRRIALTVHAGEEVAAVWDPEIVEKVVSNLLSNACKFTPAGGRIDVTVESDAACGEVSIAVQDSGIGIAPEDAARIFDRFQQVDGSTTRAHEGTGIGLSLVKELVQLHGGRIELRSAPGQGAEFTVHLPREPRGAGGAAAAAGDEAPVFAYAELETTGLESLPAEADAAAGAADAADRPLVLVVDDNRDMRRYVRQGIEAHYQVIEAVDGEDGLAQARLRQPRLVISDVMMPRLDGQAMCRAMRADEQLRAIPVVLLTAKASRETIIDGLEAGAVDCLTKPFSLDVLLAKIRGVLQRKAEHEQLVLRDRLTGLLNRGAWQQAVVGELNKLALHSGVLSLAFLDVDNFKRVNDTHGHQTGDEVLVELAATLISELRSADHVGRYGGEEFVLCVADSTGANAVRLLQRVLTAFRAKAIGERQLRCSFSAGVVEVGMGAPHELAVYVARADAAMYRAKRQGKAQVVLWDAQADGA